MSQDDPYRRLGLALAEVLRLELAAAAPAAAEAPERDGVRLLKVSDVATRLGLGQTSVEALLGKELEIVHQGRAVRVPSDSLDAYIARLRGAERQRIQGEPSTPIDIGRNRRKQTASSAAPSHRAAGKTKARSVRS